MARTNPYDIVQTPVDMGTTFKRTKKIAFDYTSVQNNYSEALAFVADETSNAYIGQYIYVHEPSTIEEKEFSAGGYVVEGLGATAKLTKLATGDKLEGSIEDVKQAIDGLTTQVSGIADKVDTLITDLDKAEASIGLIQTELETKVTTVEAKDKSVVVERTGNDVTVGVKVKESAEGFVNALKLDAEAGLYVEADEYSLVKISLDADSSNAATYHLTKNGVQIGAAIDIAKDQFIKSSEIVDITQDQIDASVGGINVPAPGKYIKFVFQVEDAVPMYLAVDDLVDIYTAGSHISIVDNAISIDTESLKSELNAVYDAKGSADAALANAKVYADAAVDVEKTRAEAAEASLLSDIEAIKSEIGDSSVGSETGIYKIIVDNEEVTAAALNDLDGRIKTADSSIADINTRLDGIGSELESTFKVKDIDPSANNGVSLTLDGSSGVVGVRFDDTYLKNRIDSKLNKTATVNGQTFDASAKCEIKSNHIYLSNGFNITPDASVSSYTSIQDALIAMSAKIASNQNSLEWIIPN
ncbi:MAG: hypothetical protein RSD85_01705 [Erysipelotrichaceae bacterium]